MADVQTAAPTNTQPSQYMCGDCGTTNEIRPKEPIRCTECGCRIMFKKRQKRMVQFEA
ncbi:DNA-directed RNA polymerases I, II, and III subunit RPABC4-like protein, partial [Cystobasidium minutum MCA 4210]|uniref:DNA-directed RNA polymerases I, II, and III subunit RPABC4-like protein n=1 Tax=Cystobasidium minutum MCA 4210 TaxID=1397322 RepID=UPI0034CFD1CE|eukprot:jgi/Rhomi1/165552/fgenesh1_kg.1_\